MPPAVLASASDPAARVSATMTRWSASPSRVKKTPESADTGKVRTKASHSVPDTAEICAPTVSQRKPAYEQPARCRQRKRWRAGASRRAGSASTTWMPASPPRAIAASTTASIKLAASVVESTYIVRNRNQTTSSASSVPPDRNEHASKGQVRTGASGLWPRVLAGVRGER